MPLADGKLTEFEVATAHNALLTLWAKNGGRQPCRSCGSPGYVVIPQLNGNRSDTLSPMGAHFRFPTVMVMCQQCGLLDQYNASYLGIAWLMPDTPPPPPPRPLDGLLGSGS